MHEYCFCFWDDNYLLVGCSDKKILLVNLEKKLVIRNIKGQEDNALTMFKINHPKYGECLITQGMGEDHIKLYI